MDISKIDKNFIIDSDCQRPDMIWLDASAEPFKIHGAYSTNPYIRMPLEVAKSVNDGVVELCQHTAGIRARFKTDSPYIAIHCEWKCMSRMPHMAFTGSSGFDLYTVDEHNKQHYFKTFVPSVDSDNGFSGFVDLSGKMTEFVLNFPLYNDVQRLYIGVKEDSKFESPSKYSNELPVVFYGSSITQGGCASRPGSAYQNRLSREFNMDYINLGFSGSGFAEDTMIEYLSNLEMSVFVSDYDHNAPSDEHLEKTHYKLYQAIREKHPNIPYIILTKPDFAYNIWDNKRRRVIMNTFCKAIDNDDNNVYYIDGPSLFADDEYDSCTVDGCHPTDLGFYRFYKAMYPVFKKIL